MESGSRSACTIKTKVTLGWPTEHEKKKQTVLCHVCVVSTEQQQSADITEVYVSLQRRNTLAILLPLRGRERFEGHIQDFYDTADHIIRM